MPFLKWFLPALAVAASLIAFLGWHIYESHRFFSQIGTEFVAQTEAIARVRELRWELTQAAHHVVLFGDGEDRRKAYDDAARRLEAELAADLGLPAQAPERAGLGVLVDRLHSLGTVEAKAMDAAREGRQDEGLDLLHSPEYTGSTGLLCAQADAHSKSVHARLQERLRSHGESEFAFFSVDVAILLFAGGLWWQLGTRLRRWRVLADSELGKRINAEVHLRQAQKMEALGQMAAGVGHDFKNLLGAILGYVDLALRAADRDHVDRASLKGIRAAAEQGTAVTGTLLAFSQKARPAWAPVDLWRLATETAALLRPMLPRGVEIETETELPAEACRVLGDRAQLQQALVNLAINAGEAMPEGGRVRIRLEASGADGDPGRICLSVADTGRGIAPEMRERIFEPFFTTKARGQGTGLGLAIVHAVAVSHGAAIDLASTPGEGTCFRLCFAGERSKSTAREPPAADATQTALIAARDAYQGALLASAVGRLGLATDLVAGWDDLLAALQRRHDGPLTLLWEEGFAGRSAGQCAEAIGALRGPGRVLVLAERGSPAIAEYEEAGCMVLERPLALAEVARLIASGGAPR